MRSILSITVVLLSFVGFQAQQRMSSTFQRDVRLERKKPSVYITFARAGQLKSPDPGDEKERVWLRLHNNTRWPLMLDMSAVPSAEYGDAGLFYDELSKGEVIFSMQCHVCTLNSLEPHRSLVFSIPRTDLAKEEGAIRVKFSYSWEDQNDVAGGREVEHHVYFYASQLPKSPQQSKK